MMIRHYQRKPLIPGSYCDMERFLGAGTMSCEEDFVGERSSGILPPAIPTVAIGTTIGLMRSLIRLSPGLLVNAASASTMTSRSTSDLDGVDSCTRRSRTR